MKFINYLWTSRLIKPKNYFFLSNNLLQICWKSLLEKATWCYQVPVNGRSTDRSFFGFIVDSDSLNLQIASNLVKFRISKNEFNCSVIHMFMFFPILLWFILIIIYTSPLECLDIIDFACTGLEKVHGYSFGDSLDENRRSKWLDFQARLKKVGHNCIRAGLIFFLCISFLSFFPLIIEGYFPIKLF